MPGAFCPGNNLPDYCLTPSRPAPSASPPPRRAAAGLPRARALRAVAPRVRLVFSNRILSTHRQRSWAARAGSRTREARPPVRSPFFGLSDPEAGPAAPGAGLADGGRARLSCGGTRGEARGPSRVLTVWVLGPGTWRSPCDPVSRSRPAFPSSFVIRPRGLRLSFPPLEALKFHQVDAGERAPRRLAASRRS